MDHEKIKFLNFRLQLKKQIEVEVQEISKEPYFDDLSKFITDYDEIGAKHFFKLKPLYDKFGYHLINGEIYRICADKMKRPSTLGD